MLKTLDEKQTKRVHELCKEIVNITGNAFITCAYKSKNEKGKVGSIGCVCGDTMEIGANLCIVLTDKDNENILDVVKSGLEIIEENEKEKFSIKKEI
jgi:hypothetical protein